MHHKLDALGIGAQHTKDPNGIAWKQNRDFENLLKRLNANSEDSTEDEVNSAPIDGFQPAHVDEPVADAATFGLGPEGRNEERKAEKEKKRKKTKRQRGDGKTANAEERKSKKRKKVEPTTAASTSEPVEAVPSNSNFPTLETIAFVVLDRSHSKASLNT